MILRSQRLITLHLIIPYWQIRFTQVVSNETRSTIFSIYRLFKLLKSMTYYSYHLLFLPPLHLWPRTEISLTLSESYSCLVYQYYNEKKMSISWMVKGSLFRQRTVYSSHGDRLLEGPIDEINYQELDLIQRELFYL